MKTLIEQSQDLAHQIDSIMDRERGAEIAKSLNEVTERVTEHLQDSRSLKTHLATIKAAGIKEEGETVSPELIQSLLKKIEGVKKRHHDNRANLHQGNTWANCNKEAAALNKKLKTGLTATWSKYIGEHVTDTSSLDSFRPIPNCASAFKQVDVANREIKAFANLLPTTLDEVEKIATKSESARKAIGELKLDGIPQEVQSFLKRASTHGVPIAELSDEVLSWLRQNEKFMAALKINTSSN